MRCRMRFFQHSADLVHQCADAAAWRQRGGWILEDRLDNEGALLERGTPLLQRRVKDADFASVQSLLAEHGTHQRRLAGSGFADDAEACTRRDRNRDAVQRHRLAEAQPRIMNRDRIGHGVTSRKQRAPCAAFPSDPSHLTAALPKARRKGRIFEDYLRN